MKSATAALNKYKMEWVTRHDVNSTIRTLSDKLDLLVKSRTKEMKKAKTPAEEAIVQARYDNEIKYIDYLLYLIKLEYYEIMGKLKR